MERHAVSSYSVRSAGYDATAQRMQIEFRSGKVYEYYAVPQSVYDWLLRVKNKGAYITRLVSGHYQFRLLSEDEATGKLPVVAPREPSRRDAAALSGETLSLEDRLLASLEALAERAPK